MKKPVLWIVILLAAALIIAVAVWGKQYYENRYVGSDYYAMVPHDFDATPEMMYSDSGAEVGLGKTIELTAYSPLGEARTISIIVRLDRESIPKPGAYLYISASKQLVVRWRVTDEGSIPEGALNMIK